MNNENRELNVNELDAVAGGMKTDPNYVSKDTVDARGGSFSVLGLIVTFDTSGKMTSVSKSAPE
jgi:hypothetical protein